MSAEVMSRIARELSSVSVAADPARWGVQPPLPRPRAKLPNRALSIIGADTRAAVTNPQDPPWGAVCRVTVTGSAGISHGSGFLVAAGWVLTAAHVVIEAGASPTIVVEPVSGEQILADFTINPPFTISNARGDDIALLKLRQASTCKPLALFPFDDAFLQSYVAGQWPLQVPGFPVDDAPQMMNGAGPLVSVVGAELRHDVDTTEGQSGSPMIYLAPSATWVMGVHGYGDGDPSPNTGARITTAVMAWIQAYTG